MDHKNDCLICGSELEYLQVREKMQCQYCRDFFEAEVRCNQGHYVCNKCHSSGALELIERYCIRTKHQDPLLMAHDLMQSHAVKMHGPEHHFLVPAVLLTAYYNTLGGIKSITEKEKKLREAKTRSEKVLGGFCGFYGACGAAVGTGIFISLITNATPVSKQEWMMSNLMTSRSLNCIACAGGPRCCKRDTFIAIREAVDFVKENLKTEIPLDPEIRCSYSHLNRECLQFGCDFYDDAKGN